MTENEVVNASQNLDLRPNYNTTQVQKLLMKSRTLSKNLQTGNGLKEPQQSQQISTSRNISKHLSVNEEMSNESEDSEDSFILCATSKVIQEYKNSLVKDGNIQTLATV